MRAKFLALGMALALMLFEVAIASANGGVVWGT